jgi:hypothetical protein
LEYFSVFRDNYLSNFSFDFLFLHGDKNPRHNMGEMGEFYVVEAILFLFGIVYLVKEKKTKEGYLLMSWAAISPLAGSLLAGPHALRNSFMLPAFIVISSLGVEFLLTRKRNLVFYLTNIILMFLLLIQLVQFLERNYFISPNKFSRMWSSTAKEVSKEVEQKRQDFDYVAISDKIDNIEYAYPLYAHVDPLEIIKQNKEDFEVNGQSFRKYNNVYIGTISSINMLETLFNSPKGSVLLVAEPSFTEKSLVGRTHEGRDGLVDYVVYEKK